jgi:hypothetical protein
LVLAATNHVQPVEWLVVAAVLAVLFGVSGALYATGDPGRGNLVERFLNRFATSLERVTGLPAWAASGIALGHWALLSAMIGFFWDVSWHIDLGRDRELLTPPHLLILFGLTGIFGAAVVSTTFATFQRARTGWRLGPVRIPYASAALGLLGFGAVMGFPLDDLWHATYGVDVTMWGPTHLLMIGGAVLSSFAFALLLTEGRQGRPLEGFSAFMGRILYATPISALTAFALEFDLGVPQFQQLYHPVLLMLAAGVGLSIARYALGRGGAVRAAVGFIIIRSLIGLYIGPGLGLTAPHFPLYLIEALGIEMIAKRAADSPLRFALVSGAFIGTMGLAAEWSWTQLFGVQPWNAALLPGIWVAVAMAFAATMLGTAAGRILSGARASIPAPLVAVAGLAVVGLMLVPLPRETTPIQATLATRALDQGQPVIDNNDRPALVRHVAVDLTLTPADAAAGADWFRVISWQGGSFQAADLRQVGPGHYIADRMVPVGGSWKSIVRLARHQLMVALPVSMPADPVIGAPEIPVETSRTASFVPEGKVLMREAHPGPAWPALVAYGAIGTMALAWFIALTLAYRRVSASAPGAEPPSRAAPSRRLQTSRVPA